MITMRFSNGFEIELVEYYNHLASWYMDSELETRQWLIDNVKPDWVCVEVGAHIGYTSMLLSTLCKEVYAFEANPKAFDMMRVNILNNSKEHDFSNIQLFNYAVGDKSGNREETMWFAGEDHLFGETHGEFEFVTLDEFLFDKVNRMDLLFIDADGWDYDVIMGANKCIEILRPNIILEANYALKWRGHSVEEVLDFAGIYGYLPRWLDKGCPGNMVLLRDTPC